MNAAIDAWELNFLESGIGCAIKGIVAVDVDFNAKGDSQKTPSPLTGEGWGGGDLVISIFVQGARRSRN